MNEDNREEFTIEDISEQQEQISRGDIPEESGAELTSEDAVSGGQMDEDLMPDGGADDGQAPDGLASDEDLFEEPEWDDAGPEQGDGAVSKRTGLGYDDRGMPDDTWMTLDDLYTSRKTGISEEDADVHIRFTTQYNMDAADLDDGSDANAAEGLSPEDQAIRDRIKERKRANAERARRTRRRIRITLITLLVLTGTFLFTISGFFTITSIEVRGNEHYTWEEILNISHAVPGRNLIYDPGTNEIVEYLEQNPYIKTATVTRQLPSTLVITVTERQEACSFKYDNDYLVMDEEGILLRKTRTEPKVTRAEGMVVSRIKLGEKIGTKDDKKFEKLLKLLQSAKKGDLYFVRIDLTEEEKNGAVVAYIYDSLMIKTDYDTLITFIKNGRLHKSIEWLFNEGIKRGTITLGSDGTVSFEPGI
ncbi:MAG: FtsQ-type POTRA domain-containing protein [Clostridiales bacterium]|nr:FtsQ-type POTRA domain-containing protein [Clostridiales bacterium]